MTSQQILTSDVLDILFECRNKMYGAYLLRRQYPMELTKALLSTITVAVLLFLLVPGANEKVASFKTVRDVEISRFAPAEVKKYKPLPKVSTATAAPFRQKAFSAQLVIVDKPDVRPMIAVTDLDNSAIGSTDEEGPAVRGWQPPAIPEVRPGMGDGLPEVPAKKETAPLSRQPQFPGGMEAWLNFLGRHLQSPDALEQGDKRTVVIRFQVAEDGAVTGFQVLQSAGASFDNEVMRVLRKMPKWIPALREGSPVSVPFTQPVTFVPSED